jgi:DNA-binding PadR family transcriptional regulator
MLSRSNDLSALQALALIFIDRGLRTSYDLQSVATLSIGSGRPLLEELQKSGTIESVADSEFRGTRPYAITDRGRELLRSAMDEFRTDEHWLASHQHLNFDSIPRCFFLEWLWGEGGNHQDWRSSLKRSLERRMEDLEKKRRKILRDLEARLQTLSSDDIVNDHSVVALVYAWMQVTLGSQLLKVQFELIDKMIEQLENMPSSTLGAVEFLDELRKNVLTRRSLDREGE